MVDDSMLVRRLPWLSIGYAFAALLLAIGLMSGLLFRPDAVGVILLGGLSYLLGGLVTWLYWLYCVYKYHDVMSSIQGYEHSISPSRAVAMHFIPLYNFYWVFKWPSEIATFVNWRMQSPKAMNGYIPGILVLAGFLVVSLGGPIFYGLGFALLFASGTYISSRIRQACLAPAVPKAMHASGRTGPLGL